MYQSILGNLFPIKILHSIAYDMIMINSDDDDEDDNDDGDNLNNYDDDDDDDDEEVNDHDDLRYREISIQQ